MVDKVAVVFGSTGGIGSEVVFSFQRKGYKLVLFSTSEYQYESDTTLAIQGDIASRGLVQEVLHRALKKFGCIDVVVFAIGTVSQYLEEALQINTIGLSSVLTAVGDVGFPISVFVIGSQRSREPSLHSSYCTSKAAAEMVVKCARRRSPHLRIILLRPGFVDTPMYKENSQLPYMDDQPYPVTQPSDIAKTIHYILDLSPGAVIEEITLGELLGDRKDLTWRPRP
jgi:NAD(P)-dependent dehydrogenase (short-subunit alcohol dehydrogenase family)